MAPQQPTVTRRGLLTGLVLASLAVPLALDALPGSWTAATLAEAAVPPPSYAAIVGLL